jgi:uncharacterized protein (DUF58 family)
MARLLRRPPGLTSRGATFLVVGSTLVVVGMLGALAPAAMFGVLVGMLPLVAALLTRGEAAAISLQRALSVTEVATGGVLDVTLTVRGRLSRGRSLLLEDAAPAALQGAHRVALRGLGGRSISATRYRVTPQGRGEHQLGPVRLHTVDPFGLVHRLDTVPLYDTVLVHPRTVPVDPLVLGGASMSAGSGHRGAPGGSSDDVVPRGYRPGDEIRRVDWKATARTGELMVRGEESLRRAAVTVVIDLCGEHHFGAEPHSSLDALLEVAASVGAMALSEGWELEVRTTDDILVFVGSPGAGVEPERRELLRSLASVPVSQATVPEITLRHSLQSTGPLLLLLGAGSAAWAQLLVGVGTHSPRRMLMAVVAEQWAHAGDRRASATSAALPPDELAGRFRGAGWRVSFLERDNPTAAAWTELGVAPW